MSALQVASSSGRRAWSAAIEAPSFQDLCTDSAISSGCVGRFGFDSFEAMPPVGATVTITFLVMMDLPGFACLRYTCRQPRFVPASYVMPSRHHERGGHGLYDFIILIEGRIPDGDEPLVPA